MDEKAQVGRLPRYANCTGSQGSRARRTSQQAGGEPGTVLEAAAVDNRDGHRTLTVAFDASENAVAGLQEGKGRPRNIHGLARRHSPELGGSDAFDGRDDVARDNLAIF